jgi:electron transport complex protein RnfG
MYKRLRAYIVVGAVIFLLGVTGCSQEECMTKQQLAVLNDILVRPITVEQVEKIGFEQELAQKFPAVDEMFKVIADGKEWYVFVVSPVGYRAPINMMVVIDAQKNDIQGIKVMQQDETPGWGEWLAESWFTDRFKGKSVDKYLKRAILDTEEPNEIVQITSATVTTQAVLNGVNSAIGIYREVVLGEKADPVPLKVEGYITESQ